MSSIVEEHARYVDDPSRLDAYAAALERVIQPTSVVLDLGAGTGLLGLMALKAGAQRVYAVDRGRMIEAARAVARDNGLADRVVHLHGDSREVELPERVDVVVADQMGPLGVEAGLVESFADARRRHLRPQGRLVPGRLSLHAALVHAPERRRTIRAYAARPHGIDLGHMERIAGSDPAWIQLGADALISEAGTLTEIVLGEEAPERIAGQTTIEVRRDAEAHGLLAWFSARLVDDIVVTNSPEAEEHLDREQLFLPLAQPLPVRRGEALSLSLHATLVNMLLGWRLRRGEELVVEQTSLPSLLLARGVLSSGGARIPRLGPKGRAQATVLELCDGQRNIEAIAREVQAQHPELLGTSAQALAFVSRVIEGAER